MLGAHRAALTVPRAKEVAVPRIIIETESASRDGQVLLTERVVPAQIESEHFCDQLIERVGWAILDAEDAERGWVATRPAASRP